MEQFRQLSPKSKVHGAALLAVICLLVFQNPLEQVFGIFRYVDECVALAGAGTMALCFAVEGRFTVKRYLLPGLTALAVFLLVGLLGNLIHGYQPLGPVLVDVITHLKFFLAIVFGYMLLPRFMTRSGSGIPAAFLRLVCGVLFALFLLERIYPLFGQTDVRYGLRSARMFYTHPTYLAGAAAFLVIAMTAFYEKKNLPFIAAGILMIAFTLRSKAIATAALFAVIFVFVLILKKELKLWHVLAGAALVTVLGWGMFHYYFVELSGQSARSVLLTTSFAIARDHFPIGTGFGTFASSAAAEHYSLVYLLYGVDSITGLGPSGAYLNDSFWPIILGQTGVVGTAAYLTVQCLLFCRLLRLNRHNKHWFVAGLFILVYLLISSTSEPAFNNATAVPLAMVLGGLLRKAERLQYGKACPAIRFALPWGRK